MDNESRGSENDKVVYVRWGMWRRVTNERPDQMNKKVDSRETDTIIGDYTVTEETLGLDS